MNFFGKALLAYAQGERAPFYLSDAGDTFEYPLKKYFRTYREFDAVEKKILRLARGNILDVGCGTGMYVKHLMKRGTVTGIDLSPTVIKVAQRSGLKNCTVADIFTYKPKRKFDTIVLLDNNLGIAETVLRTKKLLKLLSGMLAPNGQILSDCRGIDRDFYVSHYTPIYNGKRGPSFKWISFNEHYLRTLCEEVGLELQVIGRRKPDYLAKITKQKTFKSPAC